MEKTNSISNLTRNRINHQLDQLNNDLTFTKSYLKVFTEKEEQILNKKYQKRVHQVEVKKQKLYINTLDLENYVQQEMSTFNEKQDKKRYWETRKINHKAVSDLEKEKQLEALDQKLKMSEEQLKVVLAKKHDAIDQEAAITKYQQFLNEKTLDLENYKKTLESKKDERIHKVALKVDAKLEKLNRKIASIEEKIDFENDFTQYEFKKDTLLSVRNLTMQFGGLKAVDELSFDVKKGEIFGLIGPNGAGKTTVFNCITQFYKATSGEILYLKDDRQVVNLKDYKVHDVINQGVVRTFQNVELVYEVSVIENMLIAAHSKYQSGLFGHIIQSKQLRREDAVFKNKALDILKRLGIDNYAYAYPVGLPYGVLKKIELARTLMTNPKLIILDEPAAGLNDQETLELAKTIRDIKKDFSCTILLVEHDMGLVMDICDRICAISFGKHLATGIPADIKANKHVQEAYLGGE